MTNQKERFDWRYGLSIVARSWRTILGFVTPLALIPFLLDYNNKVTVIFETTILF